jgi:hypothetical protein
VPLALDRQVARRADLRPGQFEELLGDAEGVRAVAVGRRGASFNG